MGNSASKTVPITIKKRPNIKTSSFDDDFGRQIMQNIKLKELPFTSSTHQQSTITSNLRKRIELNKQRDGTISWQDFPSIFLHEQKNIDKKAVEVIKKYFSLPINK